MAHNTGYVQVPPDSTGKKISHVVLVELDYQSGTIDFSLGDSIIGATSGANGVVVKIVGTTSSGTLYISLANNSPVAFINAENIQVFSVTNAVANGVGTNIYKPSVTLVDSKNDFNGVSITNERELVITAKEGGWQFDSFGGLKTSQEHFLGLYHYEYGINYGEMEVSQISGSTIESASYHSGIIFSNPTNSGSVSRLQSHLYHPYNSGVSQKWIGSVAVGDTGKAGVIRRWGYFDDRDGIFFELSASVVCSVVRSSVTGTVVENKSLQSQWNVDRLDGSEGDFNVSTRTLDVSKGNIYFIDIQWGVGRIRFGIVAAGKRIIVHEETHFNTIDTAYMRTGTLPARMEQVNLTTSPSISQLKSNSMAVITSGTDGPTTDLINGQIVELTVPVNWTGSYRPLLSIRPKQYLLGRPNRAIAIPSDIQIYVEGNPLSVQIKKWPTLGGDTWTVPSNSLNSLEGDFTATGSISGTGVPQLTKIITPNVPWENKFALEWDDAWKIYNKADIEDRSGVWTLFGKQLHTNLAVSSSVTVVLNWKDVH